MRPNAKLLSDEELSTRWVKLLIDNEIIEPVKIEAPKPTCCCGDDFYGEDGTRYKAINAGCIEHGIKSNYIGAREPQQSHRTVGTRHAGHKPGDAV